MAQSTILASATTAATSTDVTVAAGAFARIGLFAAAGIPGNLSVDVMLDTPGDDLPVGRLNGNSPHMLLAGPGTWRVRRPVTSLAVGVFLEAA